MLTPGNISDIKAAPALLEHAGRVRYLLGDQGYDADSLQFTPSGRRHPGHSWTQQPEARHLL